MTLELSRREDYDKIISQLRALPVIRPDDYGEMVDIMPMAKETVATIKLLEQMRDQGVQTNERK